MLEKLAPRSRAESIFHLDVDGLKDIGIRGLIFDLDNTLVEWGGMEIKPELSEWILDMKRNGFKMCIVSNGLKDRVAHFARELDIPAVAKAIKPRKHPFKKALEIMGTLPDQTAVIGDQIFTDILGGNRMDLYTILTHPISKEEFVSTKAVRRLEKFVLKRLKKKGILSGQE
ncbi:MAG: YqeG family HAD IIIA-type phosphatase [Bacillota bacterium]